MLDGSLGTWTQDTQSVTMNGTLFNVYHNTLDEEMTLYVEHTVQSTVI